jgi:hypothetical protein
VSHTAGALACFLVDGIHAHTSNLRAGELELGRGPWGARDGCEEPDMIPVSITFSAFA